MEKSIKENHVILEWQAPQYQDHSRSTTWYTFAVGFVLFCVIYSIWTKAWSFTIITIATATIYWKIHNKPQPLHTMRIFADHFELDNYAIDWEDCEGYWILSHKDTHEFNIITKNKQRFRIQLANLKPQILRSILTPILPELKDRKEKIFDKIIRICKI